jgi:hypothetical protein
MRDKLVSRLNSCGYKGAPFGDALPLSSSDQSDAKAMKAGG